MPYNCWLELLCSTEVIAEFKERQPKKKKEKRKSKSKIKSNICNIGFIFGSNLYNCIFNLLKDNILYICEGGPYTLQQEIQGLKWYQFILSFFFVTIFSTRTEWKA